MEHINCKTHIWGPPIIARNVERLYLYVWPQCFSVQRLKMKNKTSLRIASFCLGPKGDETDCPPAQAREARLPFKEAARCVWRRRPAELFCIATLLLNPQKPSKRSRDGSNER